MFYTHRVEFNHRKGENWYDRDRDLCNAIVYRINSNPYRIYSRAELPSGYEFEDYESEDDSYFKVGGEFFNLKDFCRVGLPRLPGPAGGVQLASNGYFAIAAAGGEIFPISTTEYTATKPEKELVRAND